MFLSYESARLLPAMQPFAPRGVHFDSWATDNGDGTDNPDPFGGGSVNDGSGVDTSYTGGVDTSQTYSGPDSSGSYSYDSSGAYTGDQSGGAPTPVDTSGGGGGGSFAGGGLNASYSTMTDPAYSDTNNPYGPVTFNPSTNTYYQGGQAVGIGTPGQPGQISSADYGTGTQFQNWSPAQMAAYFNSPDYSNISQAGAYYFTPGGRGYQEGTAAIGQAPGFGQSAPTPMGMGGANGPTTFVPELRLPANLPMGTASGVFRDQSMAPTPTTNDAGVPMSQNGQTLFDQPQDVQDMFTGTYGDNAAAEWARENDASLSASIPQGAQLPVAPLPGQNPSNRDQWWQQPGANPVVAPVGPQAGAPPAPTPPAAPTPTTPGANPAQPSPPGTTDVALPDGTIVKGLSPQAAAALNKVLEAQSKTAADETQYKRSQDALANQRANQQLDLQRARDSAQAAYQQALVQKQTEAQAQQAAYQALMADLEKQRIEQQGQANQQASAYQQAQLAQNRQQEANRVSLEREKTDLQRRLLPTTRLARRGTTVQIT